MSKSKAERDSKAAERAAIKQSRAATGGIDGNIFVILAIIAISLVIIVWVATMRSNDGFTDGIVDEGPAEEAVDFGDEATEFDFDAIEGETPELPTELDEFEQDLPTGDDPDTADEAAPG